MANMKSVMILSFICYVWIWAAIVHNGVEAQTEPTAKSNNVSDTHSSEPVKSNSSTDSATTSSPPPTQPSAVSTPNITASPPSTDSTLSPSTTKTSITTSIFQDHCSNLTESACCGNGTVNLNCSLCFEQSNNATTYTCKAQCDLPEKDNCTTAAPTTTPSTSTTASEATPTPASTPESSTSGHKDDDKSSGQHFDAASFIGGIVLCGGLIAIVYFGLKFYKARKEQNYHTL
uniref:Uncharacterized protein n=1 Tax=Arion vulgaris TaxID=1028688 RepID=A0A0B6YC54_9EUPU